ncbi:hypothetical protein MP213Fo_16820 [Pseudochrobactrum sp. MP213Fo]
MKLTRFKEPQILSILSQAEGGVPVAELCRERYFGIVTLIFFKISLAYKSRRGFLSLKRNCS